MRRLPYAMRVALVAVAVVAVTALVWAGTVKIVVEGEDYYSIKPSMAKATSEVASGKKYVHIPLRRPHAVSETGPADDGHAKYRVKVLPALALGEGSQAPTHRGLALDQVPEPRGWG